MNILHKSKLICPVKVLISHFLIYEITRHCRKILGNKHSDKRKERKVEAADSNDVVGGLQEILKKTRELLKKKTTPASAIPPKNTKGITPTKSEPTTKAIVVKEAIPKTMQTQDLLR